MHGLTLGNHVAISWDCEFLDDDFHSIQYDGKEVRDPITEIGDDVWIGSGVKVIKGVKIGNGNVIAAYSVVTKSFMDTNVLIAGNPVQVIRRNISWKYNKY